MAKNSKPIHYLTYVTSVQNYNGIQKIKAYKERQIKNIVLTFNSDTYKVYITHKKTKKSEYTWIAPEYFDQWKKDGFTITKLSKLIPKGSYSEKQLKEKFYINDGLTKKDFEIQKVANRNLANYNKKYKTNFKSLQELVSHKQQQKLKVQRENAARKKKQLERNKLHKELQQSNLTTNLMRQIISGQFDAGKLSDKWYADAEKEIKKNVLLRKKAINNIIDDIANLPFKLRITTFEKQHGKTLDKIMEMIETA